jgi:hypothetical protein
MRISATQRDLPRRIFDVSNGKITRFREFVA